MASNSKSDSDQESNVNFLFKTMLERDPSKRRVKPVQQTLVNLDFELEESSEDEDFKIEDHQDSDDESPGESDDGEASSVGSDSSDSSLKECDMELTSLEKITDIQTTGQLPRLLICGVCLGDLSLESDEIVECDSCGITVHEACYGISDGCSVASTASSCSTEPWFCEVCKAGVIDPDCELCPNKGGIFKHTDVGLWVHLVCALYVPGVAFGEVDRLSNVTLFEMPYSKWGAKSCSLCLEDRYCRTGVCINCDAGMCKNFFHATCGQREGLLCDGRHEETVVDPFYAHCKVHSDKTKIKFKKRNYLIWHSAIKKYKENKSHHQESMMNGDIPYNPAQDEKRIERKLARRREKYAIARSARPTPWVPTQKMPRLLTTSASACRTLLRKAELMGINVSAQESQEVLFATVGDIRKKWFISPAFSAEFISYFLDREVRMREMKARLDHLMKESNSFQKDEEIVRRDLDEVSITHKTAYEKYESMYKNLLAIYDNFGDLFRSIGRTLSLPEEVKNKVPFKTTQEVIASQTCDNMPTENNLDNPEPLKVCSVCKAKKDQHVIVSCDLCNKSYHLGCLDPPMTRMPKKSKLYGWQCSSCDRGSDQDAVDTEGPRKLRRQHREPNRYVASLGNMVPMDIHYSHELLSGEHSRKRTPRHQPLMSSPPSVKRSRTISRRRSADVKDELGISTSLNGTSGSESSNNMGSSLVCSMCQEEGASANSVRCDRCLNYYHFRCLRPPCTRNPKPRGYSWMCETCVNVNEDSRLQNKSQFEAEAVNVCR